MILMTSIYCLPETYCKDDEKWIIEMLSKLPKRVRKRVSVLYAEAFIAEYKKEPIAHKKENKARREANTRLRKYVKRYSSVMSCQVCEPPIVTL